MFTTVRTLVLASILLGHIAHAELSPWYITPIVSYHFLDDDGAVDDMASLGLNAGYQFHPNWAVELGASTGRSDSDFGDSVDFLAFQVDGLYLLNPYGNWQPYGVMSLINQRFEADSVRQEVLIAAGIGSYYNFSESFRLRSDIRSAYSEANRLNDGMVNVGFEFRFGANDSTYKPAPVSAPIPAPLPAAVPSHVVTFNFSSESAAIHETDRYKIESIAQYMQQHPQAELILEGDADSSGSESYNLSLSKQRAEAVEKLIEQEYGIAKNRFTIKALGESNPIADNETAAGRIENRRVDIRLRVHHEAK